VGILSKAVISTKLLDLFPTKERREARLKRIQAATDLMEFIKTLIDFILHINVHLDALVRDYGFWVYLILFGIVFCETGLVITPFLPGDSLLFAVGALCGAGSMNIFLSMAVLFAAAVIGDTVNYWIGHWTGPKVFRAERSRWLNPQHLERTHQFMEKYGGKAIIIARFVPIIRTFAPFVAGVGRMTYVRFMVYNFVGGALWVGLFVPAGYFFGSWPLVKNNFSLVMLAIIVVSTLPAVFEFFRQRRAAASSSDTPSV
jgi:membrane-associated protein